MAGMNTVSMLPEWKNKRLAMILASPSGARMC
jgi:hypothetical protein